MKTMKCLLQEVNEIVFHRVSIHRNNSIRITGETQINICTLQTSISSTWQCSSASITTHFHFQNLAVPSTEHLGQLKKNTIIIIIPIIHFIIIKKIIIITIIIRSCIRFLNGNHLRELEPSQGGGTISGRWNHLREMEPSQGGDSNLPLSSCCKVCNLTKWVLLSKMFFLI